MRFVYILALCAAAIQCFRSGYHERVPLFFWSIISSILYEIAAKQFDRSWQDVWYLPLISIVTAMRIFAAAEAFLQSARSLRLLTAVAASSMATVFALTVAWQLSNASSLQNTVNARRVVLVWLAAFLGTYVMFLVSTSLVPGAHLLLVTALCWTLAMASITRPYFPWQAIDQAAFAICTAIYLSWALCFQTRRCAPQER